MTNRNPPDDNSTHQPRSVGRSFPWVLVTAGAVLALGVLAAASPGPWIIEERFNFDFNLIPVTERDQPTEPAAPPAESSGDYWIPDLTWLGVALAILFALLAVAALVWSVNRVRHRLRRGRQRVPHYFELPPSELADVPAVQEALDTALRHLHEVAEPSDAVIAAWIAVEEAAEASGLARHPSQTPTEFTVAVLDGTGADGEPARQLLDIYHRARFSRHPVGPGDVETAFTCLERLARSWEELHDLGLVSSAPGTDTL